jgi:hypothetical protein
MLGISSAISPSIYLRRSAPQARRDVRARAYPVQKRQWSSGSLPIFLSHLYRCASRLMNSAQCASVWRSNRIAVAGFLRLEDDARVV